MFMAMLCPGLAEPAGAASVQILQIFPVWWWRWWCVRDRRVGPRPRPDLPLPGTARLAKVTPQPLTGWKVGHVHHGRCTVSTWRYSVQWPVQWMYVCNMKERWSVLTKYYQPPQKCLDVLKGLVEFCMLAVCQESGDLNRKQASIVCYHLAWWDSRAVT